MANTTVTTNNQFTINWKDIWRGLLMAVLTPVIVIIQQSIEAGQLSFDLKSIGMAAVSGLLAYLVKNFFTPSEIVIVNPQKEDLTAIKEGVASVTVTTDNQA